MAPSVQSHNRSHSLLLLQKLLNLRDSASPLTLVLDTLEQSARPLMQEFITRAKIARSKVIFLSFATVKRPADADVFVKARGKSLSTLRSEIVKHCPNPAGPPSQDATSQSEAFPTSSIVKCPLIMVTEALIVVDALNPLAATEPRFLSAFLSSIITPAVSVVAVYHSDVPLVLPKSFSEYEPHPLGVLSHLATAVLRVSSLYQAVERRRAQNRSLQEPEWGLREGREGAIIGVKAGDNGAGDGIVLEMEMRRRSGRAVAERFVLMPASQQTGASRLSLLADHSLFATPDDPSGEGSAGADEDEDNIETTFNLGLTDKQRKDREGIFLPYFDAQTDIGAGEGGRILYEMGREDDFDDEEDEI